MNKNEATPSQRAAIESRGSALLVSAGAGSGKTHVLIERLLRYLTDEKEPRDIDSFLVITFTRAAAAELKGRVMSRLAEAAAEDPSNRRLRRQSALCRRASIQTIDGFCADLLRQNCHLLGIAPDFRIIEDDRAAQMKASALERTMESCYARPEAHPGFLALADTVGAGRDDSRLCALALELHKKMQAQARPEQWAERMIEQLRAPVSDAGETPWGRDLLKDLGSSADYWAAELERVLAAMNGEERIKTAYGESVAESAEALRDFSRALRLGWDAARERLPIPFPNLKALRASPDPALSDYVKNRREACKKACAGMEKALSSSSESQLAGMALTHDAMEALLRLTLDFDAEYARSKRRGSLLDYSDLEHFAARLLTDENDAPTDFARQIAARYTEIMVDEYQDVSRVQDAIFRALSKDGKNLFLVGDVKQSIYRFRLADPEIFTEKYRGYRDFDLAGADEPRRILLRENFRSRREIIDAANAVFSACMSRALGDVDYDEAAELRFGASYYEGERPVPELLLYDAAQAADEGETPDSLEHEAEMTARRIERLLHSGMSVTTREGTRPIRCGDVAILLRTANSVGAAFRRALLRRGIPVAAARGGEFFESLEVAAVVDLLTIIDNPHQDVPLIAVLRSPSFGFTADELSAVRAADRDADLFDALRLRAQSDAKCRAFLTRLDALRAAAPDLGCAELVWQIIGDLDLLAIAACMDEGERRRSNLLELVALSEEFESTGWRGLHRFVLWLRRLAEQGREPEGAAAGEGVQILSIHKSKGLEFPAVFLCDLAHGFNTTDSRERVLVHPGLGLGAKVTDLERRIEYPTLARTAIARRLARETRSEEMRLLYVAMTRARELLVMSACVKDPMKLIEKLRPAARLPLAAEALSSAANPLSWLVTAALADGEEHLRLRVCGAEEPEETQDAAALEIKPDERFRAELERKLSFRYAHAEAETLPSKITATELKDRAETDEDAASIAPRHARSFRLPDFAAARKPLSGAARGTATHLVLQYMDFACTGSEEAVRAEIERMRRERYLSDREAEAVDARAITTLFASPLGRRMLAADSLRREFKFSLLVGADELLGAKTDDEILLQGVVDCLIEEDGALTVIDYKTDAIRSETQLAERRELYAPQLRAYAAAMERIFRKPVRECVLYFLSPGRAARVEIG
jgi:ATP-dependent helicase/nuclease subunit A